MRLAVGLIAMAALLAPVAAATPKDDIRGATIGMTPEAMRATFADCKHKDPANRAISVRDASGGWIGQSSMTCRLSGEPDSALTITFTSSLSGKQACRIEYDFHSKRTSDALVADVMAQFGVGKPWQENEVHFWKLSSEVNLALATYTQQKSLSLRSDGLCERDKQAVADYGKAQLNVAPAPAF